MSWIVGGWRSTLWKLLNLCLHVHVLQCSYLTLTHILSKVSVLRYLGVCRDLVVFWFQVWFQVWYLKVCVLEMPYASRYCFGTSSAYYCRESLKQCLHQYSNSDALVLYMRRNLHLILDPVSWLSAHVEGHLFTSPTPLLCDLFYLSKSLFKVDVF